jgi:FkbM family methyltransferase
MLEYPSDADTAAAIQAVMGNITNGIYVDVGAGHPEIISNSFHFRNLGWDIVAIEPQKALCDEFRARGYPILELACASTDIGETDFEILDYYMGMGGSAFRVLDPQPAERAITKVKVMAYTLNTILEKYRPDIKHIDVLDIDTEYSELDILKGFDIEKYSPTVLVIENLPTDSGIWCSPFRDQLYEYYNQIGYKIVAKAGVYNEILMRG